MIEALGVVLAALLGSSLFKAKPYVLWIAKTDPVRWETPNPKGNSLRRCRIAQKEYSDHGVPYRSMLIMPLGILPPALVRP